MKICSLIELLLISGILSLLRCAEGLLCYECIHARDDADCRKNAVVKECKKNEKACQVEIREHAFFGIRRMSKRCKQARACHNNHNQNWVPYGMQCENKSLFVSVCRCCCIEDLCNLSTQETCTGVLDPNLLRDIQPNPMCEDLGDVNHGMFTCTDKNKPGSTCRLICGSGYDIYGRGVMNCQKSGNGEQAFWSAKKPCCSRPCPPHARMDIVVAIDSATSDPDEWELMKKFVLEVLGPYAISAFETQVGVLVYSEKIKFDQEINLKKYHEKGELFDTIAVQENDFKSKGGIRPSQLLRHASLKSFSEGSGNRNRYRDVMLLFRMGKAIKENESPQIPAKIMEDNGITVITVGIGENTNREEILLTVSSPDKAIHVKEGLQAYPFYVDAIRRAICGDACSR